MKITVENDSEELRQALQDGLRGFNRSVVGHYDFVPVRVAVRDDAGEIVGGSSGGAFLDWLSIDIVWVREDARRNGFGRQILHAMEEEGRRQGAKNVMLDTFEFQAEEFYKKEGYVEYGRIPDFVAGYDRIYLQKRGL